MSTRRCPLGPGCDDAQRAPRDRGVEFDRYRGYDGDSDVDGFGNLGFLKDVFWGTCRTACASGIWWTFIIDRRLRSVNIKGVIFVKLAHDHVSSSLDIRECDHCNQLELVTIHLFTFTFTHFRRLNYMPCPQKPPDHH